jgi:ketosteroid isomerase-like protein
MQFFKEKKMKLALLLAVIAVATAASVSAQNADRNTLEQEIRRLESADVAAVLNNDMAAADKLWTEDLTVNAPNNQLVRGKKAVVELKNSGTKYASFVRDIESVLVHGNTVIVMGQEIVVPTGESPDAGKTIRRRFTNVWMKRGSKWHLTARQASVICQI